MDAFAWDGRRLCKSHYAQVPEDDVCTLVTPDGPAWTVHIQGAYGVAIGLRRVFVCCVNDHMVEVRRLDGSRHSVLGSRAESREPGDELGLFYVPDAICFGSERLYVCDVRYNSQTHRRLQVFNESGKFLHWWTLDENDIYRHCSIAVADDVFVASGSQVSAFTPDGIRLRTVVDFPDHQLSNLGVSRTGRLVCIRARGSRCDVISFRPDGCDQRCIGSAHSTTVSQLLEGFWRRGGCEC
jgi:hypothetical protein